MAKIISSVLVRLTDDRILPFNASRYGYFLYIESLALLNKLKAKDSDAADVVTTHLENACHEFYVAAKGLVKLETASLTPLQRRMLNDLLIQIDKGFVHSSGISERNYNVHYLIGPSKYNSYEATSFPAITNLLLDAEKAVNWKELKKQVKITTFLIESVTRKMKTLAHYLR